MGLYARTEHGGHRVTKLARGFEVNWPSGSRTYPSARQTIMALVNGTPHPTRTVYDPHWGFDRYFRRGKYSARKSSSVNVLTLFRSDPPNQVAISATRAPLKGSTPLAVHVPEAIDLENPLGIDLVNRGHEVRKLFYAGFVQKVFRLGYEPEDVLQDVFVGILVRNRGKCPFDSNKSSFGHYVHMVIGCILSNYHRRYSRLRRNEQFGVRTFDDQIRDVAEADLVSVDAIQEEACVYDSTLRSLAAQIREAADSEGYDPNIAQQCLIFLGEGLRYKEMAENLKVSVSLISDVVRLVRRVAAHWKAEVSPA